MKIQLGLLLVVVLFVGLPSVVFAQPPLSAVQSGEASPAAPTAEEEFAKARRDAQRDADFHISSATWFAFGFFCGGIGVIAAALTSSSADPARLVGKSPFYVDAYVTHYRSAVRGRKLKSSITGCVTQSIITGLSWAVILGSQEFDF